MLIDDAAQSAAEFFVMVLQALPQTTTVGSMTAGADADLTRIPLPGRLSADISGLGAFYPDGVPTAFEAALEIIRQPFPAQNSQEEE